MGHSLPPLGRPVSRGGGGRRRGGRKARDFALAAAAAAGSVQGFRVGAFCFHAQLLLPEAL